MFRGAASPYGDGVSSLRSIFAVLVVAPLGLACSEGETSSGTGRADGGAGGDTDGVGLDDDDGTASGDGSGGDESGESGEAPSLGEPPLAPVCTFHDFDPGSALELDGVDDHVTMGVAPTLGLPAFTLEAWVRRDGAGVETGTGNGGPKLVPVVGKGRGENDDTIYNCNYVFGFADNVLAADFEDDATGANHPVYGKTVVPFDEWHHIAATYDGTTWRLYVDGALDVESTASATPRADSIQHFAIGTSMDSMGAPQGWFHGAIDEVRVWDHARSEAEIAASMREELDAGPGLVSRWAFDAAVPGAPDLVGINDGSIQGGSFGDGAPLGVGLAPTALPTSPEDGATGMGGSVELGLVIGDPEQDEFSATFHVREVTTEDDFTIVVLPDTQFYTDPDANNAGSPDNFHAQTQWVRDNREAYNIVGVIHNGDIVNHGADPGEWAVADAAMARLETPEDGLPEGVPYGVCIGNHDQDTNSTVGATVAFNQHYGLSRFGGRSYYGGHYGQNNDQNWVVFRAGGLEFVVVNIEYDQTPDPAVNAWARSVFEAHPDAFGILNMHYLLTGAGNFSTQGGSVYNALRGVDNVQLMTGGHVTAQQRRTEVFDGNVIHAMLADFQADPDGGGGFMRIWEFSPANDELTVRTYSPHKDEWRTDENNEFTLKVKLPGAGSSFEDVAVVDPAPHLVSTTVEGLQPGRTYEWYATVTDCSHTVRTKVQRFTTSP